MIFELDMKHASGLRSFLKIDMSLNLSGSYLPGSGWSIISFNFLNWSSIRIGLSRPETIN